MTEYCTKKANWEKQTRAFFSPLCAFGYGNPNVFATILG